MIFLIAETSSGWTPDNIASVMASAAAIIVTLFNFLRGNKNAIRIDSLQKVAEEHSQDVRDLRSTVSNVALHTPSPSPYQAAFQQGVSQALQSSVPQPTHVQEVRTTETSFSPPPESMVSPQAKPMPPAAPPPVPIDELSI